MEQDLLLKDSIHINLLVCLGYGDAKKGRRPSWSKAAPGAVSEPIFEAFVQKLRAIGLRVETGVFGADMQVELVNDGPVTLILDSETL